jgi:glucokinase
MILAGDIGGTKTVLAICDVSAAAVPDAPEAAPIRIVRETVYHCAEFASLEAILDQFVPAGDARDRLTGACFGVAGPVAAGSAKITNLPWTIETASLAAKLGVPVGLLNDLQATALGALALPASSFAVLQRGDGGQPSGTIAVIAPGTGLGEALLVSDGAHHRALPSEGGHADFAPTTDEQVELIRFMRGLHGEHISVERILSGAGIGDLYSFVRHATGSPEPGWLTDELAKHDRNAVISRAALDRRDDASIHALELFAEILGAEAGNFALRGLATGGVVIGGGIPPKILPVLQHPRLIDRFTAKGRFTRWTRTLAVRVALEPRAALFGAAHHAQTHKDVRS